MSHTLPRRPLALAAVATLSLGLLSACGSSSHSTSPPSAGSATTGAGSGGKSGGTLTVAMGTAPDSLDPQYGYTTQAVEADAITYTPLLTYTHANGTAGSTIIPGLAQALPTVSSDGLTYTMNLRPNLTFSDGTPVKASDFAYSIERMIKLNWGGDSFITNYVKGASDYAAGKATSISGITTDDSTGKITITLTQPYGAFENVLAFPAAALVPSGTAMKALSAAPPIGDGPYVISHVVPNVSFTLTRNPRWAAQNIPGIPDGHVDSIQVSIQSNNQTEAQQVLSNQTDIFDPGDTLPPALLAQIKSQAANRFKEVSIPQSFYIFFGTTTAPFNNPVARQAVDLAFDRTATQRLSSGFMVPGCYFLPPGIIGHPTSQCPAGDPAQPPSAANVAKAKQMIQQAGLAGTPVTVWSETRSPRQEYMTYYAQLLNQIGFKATLKVIQDAVYFQTIGNEALHPQTGFADWDEDFPNPSDFYLLLDARSIQAQNNENYGDVNDPHIQSELTKLDAVPAAQLSSVASEWQALDEYVTKQAYFLTFGYQQVPIFASTNVDFSSIDFSGNDYMDWSSISLK